MLKSEKYTIFNVHHGGFILYKNYAIFSFFYRILNIGRSESQLLVHFYRVVTNIYDSVPCNKLAFIQGSRSFKKFKLQSVWKLFS